ncbi:MAG: DUF3299 domain-containing protein [Gammaproteobacteria bacterium]
MKHTSVWCAALIATLGLSGTLLAATAPAVRQLDWDALLPADERDNFNTAPPPPNHSYLGEGGAAAMQQGSFNVNLSLNHTSVKIPGFIVPLELLPGGMVSELFLVPYFGACIHVPPPPPNQIVYVKLASPVKLESMYDAVWITGTLRTETRNSRYGAAAYTLDGIRVEAYKY